MNVERILFEYQDAKRRYEILEDKREIIRSELMPKSPMMSDMPKAHSQTDRMADYMAKIEKLEEDINQARSQMLEKMIFVSELIAKVDDTAIYQVLYYRYIKGSKWETIAEALGYTDRHLYRLRLQGLEAVSALLDDVK